MRLPRYARNHGHFCLSKRHSALTPLFSVTLDHAHTGIITAGFKRSEYLKFKSSKMFKRSDPIDTGDQRCQASYEIQWFEHHICVAVPVRVLSW